MALRKRIFPIIPALSVTVRVLMEHCSIFDSIESSDVANRLKQSKQI